ncbi:MAG TPA: ATP-binding cassette domain-containing protein [Treponemataceae bacterium]|nr:ATP-binding cassette domain-containing protein [Treponemataceae bacterium]
MKPVISIRDMKKSFGSQVVLDGVSLDVDEGSIFAVIGQSGCGKSVLLKGVIGMIPPDSGRVWFRDTELTALSHDGLLAMRRRFGYAFQNAALFDSMDVGENIAFPLREALGIKDKREIKRRVARMLEWIELPGIEGKRVDELSGGMRKRVGFARTLVMEPDVLFFDEPTTGLDPVLAETINNLVLRVNRELKVTCILITHDIPASFRMANSIAFLHQGKIVASGDAAAISASDHPMVRDFLRIAFVEPGGRDGGL